MTVGEVVKVTDPEAEDVVTATVGVDSTLDGAAVVPLRGSVLDSTLAVLAVAVGLEEPVDGKDKVFDGPRGEVLFPMAAEPDVVVGKLPVPLRTEEILPMVVLETVPVAELTTELDWVVVEEDVGSIGGNERVDCKVVLVAVAESLPFVVGAEEIVPEAGVELGSPVIPLKMLDKITPRPEDEAPVAVGEGEAEVEMTIDEAVPVPANDVVLVDAVVDGLLDAEPVESEVVELELVEAESLEAESVAEAVDELDVAVSLEDVVDVPEVDDGFGNSPLRIEDSGLRGSVELLVDVEVDVGELDGAVPGAVVPPKPENDTPLDTSLSLLLLLITLSGVLAEVGVLEEELDTTPPGPNVIPLLVVTFLDVGEGEDGAPLSEDGDATDAEVDDVVE